MGRIVDRKVVRASLKVELSASDSIADAAHCGAKVRGALPIPTEVLEPRHDIAELAVAVEHVKLRNGGAVVDDFHHQGVRTGQRVSAHLSAVKGSKWALDDGHGLTAFVAEAAGACRVGVVTAAFDRPMADGVRHPRGTGELRDVCAGGVHAGYGRLGNGDAPSPQSAYSATTANHDPVGDRRTRSAPDGAMAERGPRRRPGRPRCLRDSRSVLWGHCAGSF